jgi:hypothetical protein
MKIKQIISESIQLNEFDPGESGFGPFTVYLGDHLVDKFATFDEAKEEIEFIQDSDPRTANELWKIADGTGETVWEHDPGEMYDQMRRDKKIQFNKPDDLEEGETWAKHNNPRAGGMSKKSVNSYRRSHPGSKIQTAVTTKPSKLKKGSKAAKRRKSFCARMKGMKKSRTSAKTARDPNSNINKSLRRWNCESIEQMQELVMIAEQFIAKHKK